MSKHRDRGAAHWIPPTPPTTEFFGVNPERVLQLRIHFQKAINAKLSGLGALGGMQGLSSWDVSSDKILARDASGMLVDFDGRAAFWPWANIAWVQVLESKPGAV